MFKHNKIIFICSCCIVVSSIILGFIAFKVAKSEQNFRYNELRNSAVQELNSVNSVINNEINVINYELANLLQSAESDTQLFDLPLYNPLILNVFTANINGELIYPDRNGDFFRRYTRLFETNINSSQVAAVLNEIELEFNKEPNSSNRSNIVEFNIPSSEKNVSIAQQQLVSAPRNANSYQISNSRPSRAINYSNMLSAPGEAQKDISIVSNDPGSDGNSKNSYQIVLPQKTAKLASESTRLNSLKKLTLAKTKNSDNRTEQRQELSREQAKPAARLAEPAQYSSSIKAKVQPRAANDDEKINSELTEATEQHKLQFRQLAQAEKAQKENIKQVVNEKQYRIAASPMVMADMQLSESTVESKEAAETLSRSVKNDVTSRPPSSVNLKTRAAGEVTKFEKDSVQAAYARSALDADQLDMIVGESIEDTKTQEAARVARKDNALAEQYVNIVPENISDELPRTSFGILSADNANGFIKYFADNRYSPLIWVRRHMATRRAQAAVFAGIELDVTALISRFLIFLPQNTPNYIRYELLDASGSIIAESGYNGINAAKPQKMEHIISIPFSESFFQNWQLRAFLVPEFVPGGSLATALYMQIGGIALIMLVGSFMLIYLIRRKMDDVSKRSSFVANVSHELKTPLTSIRMYSELLTMKGAKLKEEKREKYLNIISFESERLSRLIENVLNFNRLEAKKRNYNPVEFNINEKLCTFCEQWRFILAHDNLILNAMIPNESYTTFFDADSLTQIMQNLFSNAAKYASKGGSLELSVYPDMANKCVRVVIRDHGPGIPKECRKRLFSNFYRCSNSLTDGVGGSGLGLAIARRMARDQGGDLILNPRYNNGAEFILTIPSVI